MEMIGGVITMTSQQIQMSFIGVVNSNSHLHLLF